MIFSFILATLKEPCGIHRYFLTLKVMTYCVHMRNLQMFSFYDISICLNLPTCRFISLAADDKNWIGKRKILFSVIIKYDQNTSKYFKCIFTLKIITIHSKSIYGNILFCLFISATVLRGKDLFGILLRICFVL